MTVRSWFTLTSTITHWKRPRNSFSIFRFSCFVFGFFYIFVFPSVIFFGWKVDFSFMFLFWFRLSSSQRNFAKVLFWPLLELRCMGPRNKLPNYCANKSQFGKSPCAVSLLRVTPSGKNNTVPRGRRGLKSRAKRPNYANKTTFAK